MILALPSALRDGIERAAKEAFPRECCGLIEGVAVAGSFRATALFPARNLAVAPNRFEIDPVDNIAAAKAARGRGRGIVGCYHSHPGGDPRPSPHDLSGAAEANFLWLIAATDGVHCQLAGFVYRPSGFTEIVFS